MSNHWLYGTLPGNNGLYLHKNYFLLQKNSPTISWKHSLWKCSWLLGDVVKRPSRHYPTIGLEHVPQACDWPTIKKRLCQIRQLSEAVLPHPMSFLGEFHPSNNGKYLDGYLFQAWNQPKPWCFEGPSSDLFRWEGRWCPKGSRSKNPGWSDDIQAEIADIIIL